MNLKGNVKFVKATLFAHPKSKTAIITIYNRGSQTEDHGPPRVPELWDGSTQKNCNVLLVLPNHLKKVKIYMGSNAPVKSNQKHNYFQGT